ncbi:hypothetical protein TTRE_0000709201 [Trichuris trichiura]|uniref:Uncharacterized protein n=1 Tax=Trichuris trichiura TaxID=36087 RepID=A0A077ZEG7_TRITR|nr:hypothetical protein TTRE_0000709201 [Trichuris trichiura]
MEQTMNSASELYEQFMQKSEQVLEMPAKFAQLAENATKLSAKIGQAVKSFAHFNEELKSLVDYFNHCEGTENEFCRDIMTVHQKFCLLQEEAKRLSERLVATFADPVISDQKVYTAHVKHMVTICSGVYVMNYNVKKNTKKISCLKKKPLKWKAEVFRYKRLLKPARMTTSIDDVCKNKYELFFLKALRDLTEDQIRQASLFLERLRAAAKTDCRLNTLSSTITPKDALRVSPERSDFMRWKKGDNGKRAVVIIDQSMETKRKETADVAINVSLESA